MHRAGRRFIKRRPHVSTMPVSTHLGGELSMTERSVSVVAGLILAAAAARPHPNPLLNVLALGAGSFLAYRGAMGYCPIRAVLADKSI